MVKGIAYALPLLLLLLCLRSADKETIMLGLELRSNVL